MVSNELGIIEMVTGAGLMVQFVLLLLLFFSLTSWTIIVVKFLYIRKAYNESLAFLDFFWRSRDLTDAFTKAKQLQNSPVARMFRIGYLELKKLKKSGIISSSRQDKNGDKEPVMLGGSFTGIDNLKRSLRRAINTEVTNITRMVPFLATTGNTAPFIGLFGTVWGIMDSFHDIGLKGSASLAVVAPGISEALIATACGLAVAIPAVIAFNYFMNRIRIIESELHSFSADFLNIIERDIIT